MILRPVFPACSERLEHMTVLVFIIQPVIPAHGPAAMNKTFLHAAVLTVIMLAGCGSGEGDGEATAILIEKAGAIESGDTRDPNHSDLAYDAYEFEAQTFDLVRLEVVAEGFSPLLKLMEVSTGAVIAEWDPQYGTGDALTYTIAGAGIYEARIYAMEGGTGDYTLTISVTP